MYVVCLSLSFSFRFHAPFSFFLFFFSFFNYHVLMLYLLCYLGLCCFLKSCCMLCTTSQNYRFLERRVKSNFVLYINAQFDLRVLYVQFYFVKCCLVLLCSLVFVLFCLQRPDPCMMLLERRHVCLIWYLKWKRVDN